MTQVQTCFSLALPRSIDLRAYDKNLQKPLQRDMNHHVIHYDYLSIPRHDAARQLRRVWEIPS